MVIVSEKLSNSLSAQITLSIACKYAMSYYSTQHGSVENGVKETSLILQTIPFPLINPRFEEGIGRVEGLMNGSASKLGTLQKTSLKVRKKTCLRADSEIVAPKMVRFQPVSAINL